MVARQMQLEQYTGSTLGVHLVEGDPVRREKRVIRNVEQLLIEQKNFVLKEL